MREIMPKEKSSSKLAKLINVESVPEDQKPKKTLAQITAKLNAKKTVNNNKVELASKKSSPEVIPTGVIALDYALGVGGLPRGRIGMIYGAESSWKSTVTLCTIAQAQKAGGRAAFVDGERTFDPKWAKAHGVDLDQLIVLEPETAEEAFNDMTTLIVEGIDVIVLDSLVSLAVKKELFSDDKGTVADIETEAMGIFARKVSQWCRNNVGRIAKNNTLFIVINQLRDNLSAGMFGNPISIPGGKAIKFYSSFMIGMRKMTGAKNTIKDENDEIVGHNYNLKIDKLKVGRDGAEATFKAYGAILDNYSSLFEIALKENIIEHPNNKTYIFGEQSFNGKNACLNALVSNKSLYDAVYAALLNKMQVNVSNNYDPFEKLRASEANAVDIELPSEEEESELASV